MYASKCVRTLLARAPAGLPDIEIQFFQLILAILCQDTLYYLKIQIWNIFEAYMRVRTARTRAIARPPDIKIQFFQLISSILCQDTLDRKSVV